MQRSGIPEAQCWVPRYDSRVLRTIILMDFTHEWSRRDFGISAVGIGGIWVLYVSFRIKKKNFLPNNNSQGNVCFPNILAQINNSKGNMCFPKKISSKEVTISGDVCHPNRNYFQRNNNLRRHVSPKQKFLPSRQQFKEQFKKIISQTAKDVSPGTWSLFTNRKSKKIFSPWTRSFSTGTAKLVFSPYKEFFKQETVQKDIFSPDKEFS